MFEIPAGIFANVFYQIAAMLLVAAAVGAVLRLLHQPLIVAFIVVGVVAGPSVLGLVQPGEEIDLLAHLGVALLLFIVGLKLDLRLITTLGPVALVTGGVQIALTVVLGFGLATLLGFPFVEAIYVALALTFSSTIIVVKLLSDRREIEQLHGRIALGVLIVQDVAIVVVMIALSAFAQTPDGGDVIGSIGATALRGVAFVTIIATLARWVLPRVLHAFARTPELLVLSAVAWAVTLAAAGDFLGFSEEVGAFLAGVALASSPYREALGTRLTTLRDFLLLFFFVNLGLGLEFEDALPQLGVALVLSAFVLLVKPLVVLATMGALRYSRRTSFFSAVALAQISEFSLIFAALGVGYGHLTESALGVLTAVAVVTITVSSYLIVGGRRLFDLLSPVLGLFERAQPRGEDAGRDDLCPEVIVFGLGRYGGRIADHLVADGVSVVGYDFDPRAVARAGRRGVTALYGDAEDAELIAHLPLRCARWVVSSSPDPSTNLVLIGALRANGYEGDIAVTAHTDVAAERVERGGANIVLRPFKDAADEACRMLGQRPAA